MELEIGGGGRRRGRRKEEDWKSFDGIRLKVASKGKNGQHSLVKRKKGKRISVSGIYKMEKLGNDNNCFFSFGVYTLKNASTQIHTLKCIH